MYQESELLPVSALQHLLFCERQCALIHLEGIWDENLFTAEGRLLHQRVDESGTFSRQDIRVCHGLRLRSLVLGLSGQADVVEFHRISDADENECLDSCNCTATSLINTLGLWKPYPIEYKRGKDKPDSSDEVQLCAQALCLEEMMGCEIEEGALFYGKTRRRKKVPFKEPLRELTIESSKKLHNLIKSGRTPSPVFSSKCGNCSLFDFCMPRQFDKKQSVRKYVDKELKDSSEDPDL